MAQSKALHSVTAYVERPTNLQLGYPAIFVEHGNTEIDGDGSYITPDADGVYTTRRRIVFDLSHALSYQLGKQIPQTAIFRMKQLQIQLCNVDDSNDNDEQHTLQGRIRWEHPNKWNIEAIQEARKAWIAKRDDSLSSNAWFGNTTDEYKGFRFGMKRGTDVLYPSE